MYYIPKHGQIDKALSTETVKSNIKWKRIKDYELNELSAPETLRVVIDG